MSVLRPAFFVPVWLGGTQSRQGSSKTGMDIEKIIKTGLFITPKFNINLKNLLYIKKQNNHGHSLRHNIMIMTLELRPASCQAAKALEGAGMILDIGL